MYPSKGKVPVPGSPVTLSSAPRNPGHQGAQIQQAILSTPSPCCHLRVANVSPSLSALTESGSVRRGLDFSALFSPRPLLILHDLPEVAIYRYVGKEIFCLHGDHFISNYFQVRRCHLIRFGTLHGVTERHKNHLLVMALSSPITNSLALF